MFNTTPITPLYDRVVNACLEMAPRDKWSVMDTLDKRIISMKKQNPNFVSDKQALDHIIRHDKNLRVRLG